MNTLRQAIVLPKRMNSKKLNVLVDQTIRAQATPLKLGKNQEEVNFNQAYGPQKKNFSTMPVSLTDHSQYMVTSIFGSQVQYLNEQLHERFGKAYGEHEPVQSEEDQLVEHNVTPHLMHGKAVVFTDSKRAKVETEKAKEMLKSISVHFEVIDVQDLPSRSEVECAL